MSDLLPISTSSIVSKITDNHAFPVIERPAGERQFDESLASLNLVEDTANYMDTLMREESIHPEAIKAASSCSQQIYQFMKLKWDILKIIKGYD